MPSALGDRAQGTAGAPTVPPAQSRGPPGASLDPHQALGNLMRRTGIDTKEGSAFDTHVWLLLLTLELSRQAVGLEAV